MEGMMHYKDARDTYCKALDLDPSNTKLEEGIKRAEEKLSKCFKSLILDTYDRFLY